jgi:hypothetical protein
MDNPYCWVIPGDDNARDNGAIDAMAWQEGEFSKPLYTKPEPKDIKPLVWNEYHREGNLDELDAETPFGTFYSIKLGAQGWHLQHDYSPFLGIFEGLEAAMTAAQQDYEKRIRIAYGE